MRALVWALAAVAALVAPAHAWAQDKEPPPESPAADEGPRTPPAEEFAVYEGRVIRKVILQQPVKGPREPGQEERYEPVSEEISQLVRNQLRCDEGTPYRQVTVTADVTRLNRLGRFNRVESRVQMLDDGTLYIIYTLVPQPIVRDVQSVGNRRLSDEDIAKETELLVGTPVDRYQLDRACRRVEALYREKGYYLAQVTVDEKDLEEQGIVLFRVREGEKLKVTEVRFEGNKNFSPRELKTDLKTKQAWLFFKGQLEDSNLEDDVTTLITFYKDRGYLDVRVGFTVRPSPNGKEAVVTYLIEEGPVYTLRKVIVYYPELSRNAPNEDEARKSAGPGETVLPLSPGEFAVYSMGVFTPEQVVGLMEIKPGEVYSQNKLRKSLEAVKGAMGVMGYTEANVTRRELRDPERPEVDILMIMYQGEKFRTGEVIIQGNELTKDAVIRRHLELKPDRPADPGALEESKRRIDQTNLFDRSKGGVKLTFQQPDPANPGYRDLLTEVEETNTGNFNIGASVSSDAGLFGIIGITQKNFDVTDTPDSAGELVSGRAFRGAGQTFSIQAQPGTEVSNYSISLTEPSLLETDYSGNATAFYRTREYDNYDEQRYGLRLGVGRRFGTRWSGNIPIVIENVNLYDIEADEPTDVFESEGGHGLTKAGVSLTRQTFDNPIRPTKGSRIEVGVDQAGALGGDYDFTSFRFEHKVFVPVFEDFIGRKTILSLSTRAQYIPQGRDATPVFERYYLGGQSFRGFRFRTISPRGVQQNGEPASDPIGGTWLFFFGPEIHQPLLDETITLVGFVDTGTVTFDPGFEEYRVSVGFGIRLYIPQLSPAPLAFDFGFPILSQETDRERVFSFTVDLPWN